MCTWARMVGKCRKNWGFGHQNVWIQLASIENCIASDYHLLGNQQYLRDICGICHQLEILGKILGIQLCFKIEITQVC